MWHPHRFQYTLQGKWRGAPNSQLCILTIRIPGPQKRWGAFIFRVAKLLPKWQQCCYSHYFTHYFKFRGTSFWGVICIGFINAMEAIVLWTTLEEIWHTQLATTMQVGNSTCDGIMSIKIQQSAPRQWTCIFIGWEIESNKDIFTYFGNLDWET